jgi:hypothetical protein
MASDTILSPRRRPLGMIIVKEIVLSVLAAILAVAASDLLVHVWQSLW